MSNISSSSSLIAPSLLLLLCLLCICQNFGAHSMPTAKIDGISLADMDRAILPYALDWSPENEWTQLDPLRLKKRWSTQLRFGKRAAIKPWSSQVRFG